MISAEKELLERLGTQFCSACREVVYCWDFCRKHFDEAYPDFDDVDPDYERELSKELKNGT